MINKLELSTAIFEEFDDVLVKQGYAGLTDVSKLVYLCGISRIFSKPVSLVLMGPSGSGKTYAIESGLQFINPEAIENLSGMSEKSLVYLPEETSLKHRILYVGEAAGMADGDGRTFLRQLLTEGRLSYLTVQKTANGMTGKKTKVVEGPVAFVMATTANRIHHEDQSRMLVINLPEDPSRIRWALKHQALGLTKDKVSIDLTPWHDLSRYLADNRMKVEVPYAGFIADYVSDRVPANDFKIQRDFPKVLALLEACALVHFRTRDQAGDCTIKANEADYETIYSLLNRPLSEGLGTWVKPGVKVVVGAVEALQQAGTTIDGISHSKLAEHLKMDRSTVGRNIHAAIDGGYLSDMNPGKGRESKVVLGDRKIEEAHVLPTPDEVFRIARPKAKLPW